jgi:hypothetical protein
VFYEARRVSVSRIVLLCIVTAVIGFTLGLLLAS